MLFSSPLFLFLFLPITLLVYYIFSNNVRNYWLLFSSLIFFAWGGVSYTSILLISIIANYFFGILIQRNIDSPKAYRWLFAGVSVNILLLGFFKYFNFFISNLNIIFKTISIPEVPQPNILLPIGISFYTFHSLSYLVDIYRRKTLAQKNIFDLSLYICMFSQLIAGPIIRYSDVWMQLKQRTHTIEKFSSGIERFLLGLGKKVLIANTFAIAADDIFSSNLSELVSINAWFGIICYTLQIYFDFAGYSDMAIGLGRMFGFEFMENFNFPYMAKSIKDFWRRWHISLSTFFRDYAYIPLGGNRGSVRKTYLNLILVFLITGFWHGASWNFVVWGMLHGLFLAIERLGFDKVLSKLWSPLQSTYTLFVVMIAWVLFRSENLSTSLLYYKALINFKVTNEQLLMLFKHINREFIIALFIAILGSLGFFSKLWNAVQKKIKDSKSLYFSFKLSSYIFYIGILVICSVYLIAGTYNPFIYYRF